MDAWIWRQAGKPYDKDAEWARAGKLFSTAAKYAQRPIFLATRTEKHRTRIL